MVAIELGLSNSKLAQNIVRTATMTTTDLTVYRTYIGGTVLRFVPPKLGGNRLFGGQGFVGCHANATQMECKEELIWEF